MNTNTITPAEAHKIIQSGEVKVIDVRTPAEFAEGHIEGARNIDIHNDAFQGIVRELPNDETYIVTCKSGGRSAQACSSMQEEGIMGAINLEGGMTAWEQAGLPIVK
ncbi:MAG: rhodanese-like domain-containing protein [Candidatus Paceibacterota bacterium]|jgi:rhodanese-related sulfurtransferase